MKRSAFIFACLMLFSLVATAGAAKPLSVVVSILPQKYLVERIGGDAVKVMALVTPGAEPHTYEPSPSQMKEASQADIYFTLGLPFEEAWVPRLAGSAPQLKVISSIEGIARIEEDDHDHEAEGEHGHDDHDHTPGEAHSHGGEDPHTWLSPRLVRHIASVTAKRLAEAMPEKAEVFRANAAALDAEIAALDEAIAEKLDSFPPEKRYFLTFHPTWGYYAAQYRLTELSIEVEGKEPSAKAMARIIATAKEHGLKTVFIEPQFSRSAAQAIAENIGAKIVEINPLEENWFTLMNTFTDALVTSFQTNQPPK